jgi:hypothetical protein
MAAGEIHERLGLALGRSSRAGRKFIHIDEIADLGVPDSLVQTTAPFVGPWIESRPRSAFV